MLNAVKKRCGIADAVKVYDDEIQSLIDDCKDDLILSGVDASLIESKKDGVITAITLYVKAYMGNDRTDTDKYLELYSKKVVRLTLEEPVAPVQPEAGRETCGTDQ